MELPSYADSVRPTSLPGFTNPRCSVEGEEEEEEEERREGEEGLDADDLPPPYSPGGFGQRDGKIRMCHAPFVSVNEHV